jgi:hypothetical protein
LIAPVRWHHAPLETEHWQKAAAVIYTANRLSHRYGFGCVADEEDTILEDGICRAIGVDANWLAATDQAAQMLVGAARQMVS